MGSATSLNNAAPAAVMAGLDLTTLGLGTPAHVSLQCHLITERTRPRSGGQGGWLSTAQAEALPNDIAEAHGAELYEGELHLMTQQHRVRIRWHRFAHAVVTETLLSPLKSNRITDPEEEMATMQGRHEAVVDVLLKSMPAAWNREELMVLPPLAAGVDALEAVGPVAKLIGCTAAGQVGPEVLYAHGPTQAASSERIPMRRAMLMPMKRAFSAAEPLPGRIVDDLIGRTNLEGLYEASEDQANDIGSHADKLQRLSDDLPPKLREGGEALSHVLTEALTTLAELAAELYPLRAVFERYTSRLEQVATDLGAIRGGWSQPYGLGMQLLGDDGRRALERARRSVERNREAVVRQASQLEGLQALIEGALEVEQDKRHLRLQQTISSSVLQNTKLVETLEVLLAQEEVRARLEQRQVRGLKLVSMMFTFYIVFSVIAVTFLLFFEGSGGICMPRHADRCESPLDGADLEPLIWLGVLISLVPATAGALLLMFYILVGVRTKRSDSQMMADARVQARAGLEELLDDARRSWAAEQTGGPAAPAAPAAESD